ncbi:MAG: hypothetical protein AXA67_10405 [Methylothermaceae bacteria B42]|nr:MAG: hypothetical protein AXA67_10405 [Methylothermaceae bacteria B42]
MPSFPLRLLFIVLILIYPLPPVLGGEPLNEEILSQEQKTVEAAGLSDEQRKQALEWLGQAGQWLRQAESAETNRKALAQRLQTAPKRLKQLRRLLQNPALLTRQWPTLNLSRPLDQLEIQLTKEINALTALQASLEKKEEALTDLLAAVTTDGQRIAQLQRQLTAVENELKAISDKLSEPLTHTRYLALEGQRRWLLAELEWLRLRQANVAILTELTRAERDLLALQLAERQTRIERLRQAIESIRQQQTFIKAQKAEKALRAAEKEVRPEIEKNLVLWSELKGLIKKEKALKSELENLKKTEDRIRDDFDKTRRAVELLGTDEALARLLFRSFRNLPSLSALQQSAEKRHALLRKAILRRFEIEEALQHLSDLDRLTGTWLQNLPENVSKGRRAVLKLQLKEALKNRREALQALRQEYTRYLGTLSELDATEKQLVELIASYREYIEQKLLWIRYRKLPSLQQWVTPLQTFTEEKTLSRIWHQLAGHFKADPAPPLLTLLFALILLALRQRAHKDLEAMAQATHSIRSDNFLNTLRALLDTVILAAPLPILLYGIGLWLQRKAVGNDQLFALAQGLIVAGRPAATMGLLRQICRPEGLAHRHLRWLQATREQLWRHLRWFYPLAVICAFIVASTSELILTDLSLTLGRWTFAAFMVIASGLIYHLWRWDGPIISQLRASRPSWVVSYHALWLPAVVLIPLLLAIAAAVGYYYAAYYLARGLFRTLWYFVALMLVKDFLLRWIYVTERRLRYQEILRRREELKAQRAEEEHESELPPVEEPQVDFGQLGQQTRRLLHIGFFFAALAGLWLIWKDAVPALSFLEEITLPMTTTKIVGGVPKTVALTLADLVTGLILGILTMLAAKNVSGLLEFLIFQRLPMEKGARYAWTTLTQYMIAALGIYVVFASLGVQWSEIQWLLAALSVGVGFGLQEVVANFISGLILLFERPIRVGDIVTVADVTGTVSRIRIRATTILNWDRQEFIIPNKKFITGEFINWTLSDPINRVLINVGIAYGSDVHQAMDLIREVVESHPEVLEDPKPLITFEEFGDDALLIIIRAYLGTMDNRLSTITELHHGIYEKLNAAGIEIAFPQRDVHLDTRQPLEIKITDPAKEKG